MGRQQDIDIGIVGIGQDLGGDVDMPKVIASISHLVSVGRDVSWLGYRSLLTRPSSLYRTGVRGQGACFRFDKPFLSTKILSGRLVMQRCTRRHKDAIAGLQSKMIDALSLVDQPIQALGILYQPVSVLPANPRM